MNPADAKSISILGWTLRTRSYARKRSGDVSEYWDAHKHVNGDLLRVYIGKGRSRGGFT
jgi:hypothetical protein